MIHSRDIRSGPRLLRTDRWRNSADYLLPKLMCLGARALSLPLIVSTVGRGGVYASRLDGRRWSGRRWSGRLLGSDVYHQNSVRTYFNAFSASSAPTDSRPHVTRA